MTDLWWKCSYCGETNPPRMEYCSYARCRRPAPWKAKPTPLPPRDPEPEKPKTPKPAWLIKLSVWMTVLTPLIFGMTFFLPPPWNGIIKALFEILKQIINM